MANTLYLGGTPLIDLSGYATTGYVDSAVANVDVTDQLTNYVEKDGDKVLSTNDFTDALKTKLEGLANYDDTSVNSAISAIQGTLSDITDDSSAAVQSVIDTWNELKAFVSDYSSAEDLKDVLDTLEGTIHTWVEAKGYLVSNDVSTFITENDASVYALKSELPTVPTTVSSFTNDAGYLVSDDISTYALKSELPTVPTTVSSFTNDAGYLVSDDVSTKINGNGTVTNIVKVTAEQYAAIETKSATTLYIVD